MMRGHLESSTRRSDYGFMITYSVSSKSIILDTRIFGSIYGEDEIVIDSNKAKIKDIERV